MDPGFRRDDEQRKCKEKAGNGSRLSPGWTSKGSAKRRPATDRGFRRDDEQRKRKEKAGNAGLFLHISASGQSTRLRPW
jgi:hypothetical protein